jgi:hypothetical protein
MDASVVCVPGYSASVRDVSESEKGQVYFEYGITDHSTVEVDHFVPLEIGGSNALGNLWAEPYLPKPGAREKDLVENYLHREVCAGRMSLVEAQKAIVEDWYRVYVSMSN